MQPRGLIKRARACVQVRSANNIRTPIMNGPARTRVSISIRRAPFERQRAGGRDFNRSGRIRTRHETNNNRPRVVRLLIVRHHEPELLSIYIYIISRLRTYTRGRTQILYRTVSFIFRRRGARGRKIITIIRIAGRPSTAGHDRNVAINTTARMFDTRIRPRGKSIAAKGTAGSGYPRSDFSSRRPDDGTMGTTCPCTSAFRPLSSYAGQRARIARRASHGRPVRAAHVRAKRKRGRRRTTTGE